MEKPINATIAEHFGSITDPRIERTKRHKLINILIIAICAVICGCDNWEDIAEFGTAKQEWFVQSFWNCRMAHLRIFHNF